MRTFPGAYGKQTLTPLEAHMLTEQHLNYWQMQERLRVSYSQAASNVSNRGSRSHSKHARGHQPQPLPPHLRIRQHVQAGLIYPPLPPGEPPPLPHEREDDRVLRTILEASKLESYRPPSERSLMPPDFDFDKTNIKVFLDWCDGKIPALPQYVASEVGLDLWLYELRGKPTPTIQQEQALRRKMVDLANQSPFRLHEAVETRTLKDLLGSEFDWLESNTDW